MSKDLRIVAIGASAGGLEALYDFFDNMPDNTNLAFVVIQHLSPNFKSMMDELLSKHTAMSVEVIQGDTKPMPNRIYLIPSGSNITIKNGVIRQVERYPTGVVNLPIDVFFHALGNDQREKAVGIILSGSGTDGSRGIQTIKEMGGLVFVQDPATAQFDGMPVAANATGLADSVLPPFAMARELVRITSIPFNGNFPTIDPKNSKDEELLNQILNRVADITGVDFKEYRTGTLIRRTEKRMTMNNIPSLESYYEYILENEAEARILFKEFLIGVTRFFRDKDAFAILKEKVIEPLVDSKEEHETIRIWIPGCTTGEEAYSIGMLFLEYMHETNKRRTFKIFATDIDRDAINYASEGNYPDSIAGDVNAKLLSKYFNARPNVFSVKKILRQSIVFAAHDALRDPPFIRMDLISCRNLLIYINPAVQQNMLKNFQFALNLNAFLFLGPSENLGAMKKVFETVDHKWKIFKNISTQKLNHISSNRRSMSERPELQQLNELLLESETELHNRNYDLTFQRMLSERYAPKSIFMNDRFEILFINGDFDDLLTAPRVARLNLLEMIGDNDNLIFRNGLRKVSETNKPNIYKNVLFRKGEKSFQLDIRFEKHRPRELNEMCVYLIEFFIKGEKIGEVNEAEVINLENYKDERLQTLDKELRQVRQEKQTLREQLETTNEELQASNEELLAANEELQSTNEELQSVNEELYTVNTELQSKIDELLLVNTDTNNLLKSTEIGTIFLDLGLRIRKFTPALQDQFNLLEADIGRPITHFTNAFNDQRIYDDIKNVLNDLNTIEREVTDKEGNIHLMRVLPYRTEENTIDGVVITFVNINDLKLAHKEVEEWIERYYLMESYAHDQMMITDLNGKIEYVNYVMEGFEEKQILGHSIFEFMPSNYAEAFQQSFISAKTCDSYISFEFSLTTPVGERTWWNTRIVPIKIKDRVTGMVLISQNSTKLVEQEQTIHRLTEGFDQELQSHTQTLMKENQLLKLSNEFMDGFVEGAVADLLPNIQLLGENGHSENGKQYPSGNGNGNGHSENLKQLVQTVELLQEMVDFQRDASQLVREIDLRTIFEEVKKEMQAPIKSSKAKIQTKFGRNRSLKYIPAYARQIFKELLDNSLRYRHNGRTPEIQIILEKTSDFHILSVQDNGSGMDLQRYGHFLFRPFKRLTIEGEGSGTGLSIANFLICKNGGRLEVESSTGKGTIVKACWKAYT